MSESQELPPCAPEIEQALLGEILVQPDLMPRLRDIITDPKMFYRRAHQVIFAAMLTLSQQSLKPDYLMVSQQLKDEGELLTVGGMPYLVDLADGAYSPSSAESYAKTVRDRFFQRESRKLIGVAAPKILGESDDAQTALISISRALDDLKREALTEDKSAEAQDVIRLAVEQVTKRFDGKEPPGIPTGWPELDHYLTGWQPGNVIVIAARPGMGKTSLGFQSILKSMTQPNMPKQHKWLVFSIEMTQTELGTRMLSLFTGISGTRLRRANDLGVYEWNLIYQAQKDISALPLKIYDGTFKIRTWDEIEAHIRREWLGAAKPDGIMIDYLQLLDAGGGNKDGYQNRNLEISEITKKAKRLANELQIPILLLSQLSRSLEQRQNKRPMLSDLRDSGAVEQDADVVAFIYREVEYNSDTVNPNLAEIIIAKHRGGPVGTANLHFSAEVTNFFSPPDGWQPLPEPKGGKKKQDGGSRYKKGGLPPDTKDRED